MILSLTHLLFVNFSALVALFLLGSVSYVITKSLPRLTRVLISLVFGMFIIINLSYLTSSFGVSQQIFSRLLTISLGLTSSIVIFIYARRRNRKSPSLLPNQWERNTLVKIFAASFIPIILPFLYFTRHSNYLPIFTRGNNDVGAYLLESSAILRSGFHNSGFLQNQNFFDYARTNDYGAPSILSWLSSINFLQPAEAITPFICVIAFIFILSFVVVVKEILDVKSFSTLAIALISVANPPILYLFSHIFLSQLLGMAIVSSLIAILLSPRFFSGELWFKRALLVSPILSLLFFTYSFMVFLQITFFVILGLVMGLANQSSRNRDGRSGRLIKFPSQSVIRFSSPAISTLTIFAIALPSVDG